MRSRNQPVYMIGVAAKLCGVHPQTLRQYEKLGLCVPARIGDRNRLYSEEDIERVRKIQRLTQEMGVNLAGVELILRLLDEMEEMKADFERRFREYAQEAERRILELAQNPSIPIRKDETLLPVPDLQLRPKTEI